KAKNMKRRDLLKYLSIAPIFPGQFFSVSSAEARPSGIWSAVEANNNAPKRIAAIITEYRPISHADVIVGKYLEGYNQDQKPPFPRSKIVSIFTEQVPETDMSREIAKKYNVPIFRTVAEALTLGGKELAVDGVL